jgi:hypothetical protein
MADNLKGQANEKCLNCGHEHERKGYKNNKITYAACKIVTIGKKDEDTGKRLITKCRCQERK